jgi:hypothetical protein
MDAVRQRTLTSLFQFILCFLELILERHRRLIDTANTLVLNERELETMTFSLRNLVAAVSMRYHSLTESWKQQRLETGFLVQCFAGGIFNDWHEVFQDVRLYRIARLTLS